MTEARIGSNFSLGGVDIYISRKAYRGRLLMRPGNDGMANWEIVEPGIALPGSTLSLPDDAARALLDALIRHYQGASDMHTVRADLLHERSRVDKLTDAIIRLAGS